MARGVDADGDVPALGERDEVGVEEALRVAPRAVQERDDGARARSILFVTLAMDEDDGDGVFAPVPGLGREHHALDDDAVRATLRGEAVLARDSGRGRPGAAARQRVDETSTQRRRGLVVRDGRHHRGARGRARGGSARARTHARTGAAETQSAASARNRRALRERGGHIARARECVSALKGATPRGTVVPDSSHAGHERHQALR